MEIKVSKERLHLFLNCSGAAFENKYPQTTTAYVMYDASVRGLYLIPFLFSQGIKIQSNLYL